MKVVSVKTIKTAVRRQGHSVCCVNGILYLFGGHEDPYFKNTLHYCNSSTKENKWIPLLPLDLKTRPAPSPRMFTSFHSLKNRYLIIYGGWQGPGNRYKKANDIFLYNLQINKWTELFPVGGDHVPSATYSLSSIMYNSNTLYIFGGVLQSNDFSNMVHSLCFDRFLSELEKEDNMNDYNYIDYNMIDTSIDINRDNNLIWKKLPSELIHAVEGHSAVLWRDNMVVYGGQIKYGITNELWMYDITTSIWKHIKNISGVKLLYRLNHDVDIIKDEMITCGGTINSTEKIQIINLNTRICYELLNDCDALVTYRRITLNVCQNKIIIFGGLKCEDRLICISLVGNQDEIFREKLLRMHFTDVLIVNSR